MYVTGKFNSLDMEFVSTTVVPYLGPMYRYITCDVVYPWNATPILLLHYYCFDPINQSINQSCLIKNANRKHDGQQRRGNRLL